MSAVTTARTTACPRWWPACGRRPDTCPGRQTAADTSMATDTSLATCAGHRPSGRRSFRTVAVRTAVVSEAADGQSTDRSLTLWT